jgi:hypothetical protein
MNTIFQVMTLAWSLQGGMIPDMSTSDRTNNVLNPGPLYFAEYGFELSYPIFSGVKSDENGIYLGTSLRNEFVKADTSFQMDPVQDTYTFNGGVRWNELTAGFAHSCTHSVENLVYGQIATQKLFGSIDKIFVKLSGKI